MGHIQHRYKIVIENEVSKALENYITGDLNMGGDEIDDTDFKEFLRSRKKYYTNHFSNRIISKKPTTKLDAVGLVAMEVINLRAEWDNKNGKQSLGTETTNRISETLETIRHKKYVDLLLLAPRRIVQRIINAFRNK